MFKLKSRVCFRDWKPGMKAGTGKVLDRHKGKVLVLWERESFAEEDVYEWVLEEKLKTPSAQDFAPVPGMTPGRGSF